MKPNEYSQLGGFEKYLRPVAYSALAGAVATGVLLVLFALIMSVRGLPQSAVEPVAVVSAILGSFIAGMVCGRLTRQKALLYGAVCGIVMFLLFSFINLMISGQGFGLLALIRLLMFVPSAMIGTMIGVNRRKKRRL